MHAIAIPAEAERDPGQALEQRLAELELAVAMLLAAQKESEARSAGRARRDLSFVDACKHELRIGRPERRAEAHSGRD